jgi:hypothetical protein
MKCETWSDIGEGATPISHAWCPQGLPKNIEATRVSMKYSASTKRNNKQCINHDTNNYPVTFVVLPWSPCMPTCSLLSLFFAYTGIAWVDTRRRPLTPTCGGCPQCGDLTHHRWSEGAYLSRTQHYALSSWCYAEMQSQLYLFFHIHFVFAYISNTSHYNK